MELAGQLSMISVGIGIVLVVFGLVKFFRHRAEQKRQERPEPHTDG